MKKFVMGLVLGIGLTIAVSAAAEGIQSLVGKQVDGQATVVLDGNELGTQAVIIEGTSYAPVRAIGEAVGREVGWEGGKVTLDSKQAVSTPSPTVTPAPSVGVYPKDVIEAEIQRVEVIIHGKKGAIEQYPGRYDTEENRKILSDLEAELAVWKQRLADLK